MIRYYGAYASRNRKSIRAAREALAQQPSEDERESVPGVIDEALPGDEAPLEAALPGSAEAVRRQAWARLIRRVFEVNPMVCPRCQIEMEVVALITEPAVIDKILRHREKHGLTSPFEANPPRAPPDNPPA